MAQELLVLFPAGDGRGHVGGDGPGHGGGGAGVAVFLVWAANRDGLVSDCFLFMLVAIVLDTVERQAGR